MREPVRASLHYNPQSGGLACLDPAGRKEIDKLIDYYMENAALLRKTMMCAEIRAETHSCQLSLHGGRRVA